MHFAYPARWVRLLVMSISTDQRPQPVRAPAARTAEPYAQLTGIALMTGSAAANQFGAATAALAFPVPGLADWLAITAIVTANAVSVSTS